MTPLESYAGTKPVLIFDRFFTGALRGHAIVQSRGGKFLKSFTVDMLGSWLGNKGALKEHFRYSDGKTQDRVWSIAKLSDTEFTATADDSIGIAEGKSCGMAITSSYVMRLPVENRAHIIAFDDWMFLANEGLVINKSTMRKFGLVVGSVTILIEKK